jgi:hypothetical protein
MTKNVHKIDRKRLHGPLRPNSIQAVAAEEGFSVSFLYRQIATGKLVARKCGRRTVIAPEDRSAWLSNLPKIKSTQPHAA